MAYNTSHDSALKQRLQQCYSEHSAELISYTIKHFGLDKAQAEDIVQNAFIKISESNTQIQNMRVYAFRVVHNLAIDLVRKHKRHGEHNQQLAHEQTDTDERCPERDWTAKQLLTMVNNVIWGMPEKRRKLFIMHRVERLSYAEIGRQMGISESAVRKHVAKGLDDCIKAMGANHD